MFIANIPITAMPRTMSSVTTRLGDVVTMRPRCGPIPSRARLQLNVILQAHRLDQVELPSRKSIWPSHLRGSRGEVAADIVAHFLAMGDDLAVSLGPPSPAPCPREGFPRHFHRCGVVRVPGSWAGRRGTALARQAGRRASSRQWIRSARTPRACERPNCRAAGSAANIGWSR